MLNFATIYTMNKDYVTHSATITLVTDRSLTLRLEEAGSCDGCAVASMCNKGKSSGQDTITIDIPDTSGFSKGERIEVTASSGSTLRASWWALLLPTLIFLGVLLAVSLIHPGSGAWSLAAGFAALALYDLILYLMRRRLAGKIAWRVRRLSTE